MLFVWATARIEQARENRELDRILHSRVTVTPEGGRDAPSPPAVRPRRRIDTATPLGRLEIPRLRLSAAVKEGDDASTLRRAVGHIPGTALPGERGNAGFAAHRDTFFRRLKDVRVSDVVTLTTPDGVHRYEVTETMIVNPTDVHVLDDTPSATLTLVTCYPFNYVGSAPQRFIVRAVSRDDEPIPVATGGRNHVATAPVAPVAMLTTPESTPRSVERRERVSVSPPTKPTAQKPRPKLTRGEGKNRTRTEPRTEGNRVGRFFKGAARRLGIIRQSEPAKKSGARAPRGQ